MKEVLIVKRELAYEIYDYVLDEEVTEADEPDDLVELSEEEIKEIRKGLDECEELQNKMAMLRKTRKINKEVFKKK